MHSLIKFCVLSLFIAISSSLFAQQTDVESIDPDRFVSDYKHNIGVGIGLTIGQGIAYKYLPKRFGFQVLYSPIITDNRNFHNAGLSFIYKLQQTPTSHFYVYQATNLELQKTFDTVNGQRITTRDDSFVELGFGFGLEFNILKRLRLNMLGGGGVFEGFEKGGITAEAALFYAF